MSNADAATPPSSFYARRHANWVPLGLAYASFYLGRYHLPVINGEMAKALHLDLKSLSVTFGIGLWAYAASVLLNGPIADRLGGRNAFVLGGFGTATINAIIGCAFYFGMFSHEHLPLELAILYCVNMYFQSFGALSVVKINSAWFAVRERGAFGGLFGGLIGIGGALPLAVIGATQKWGHGRYGDTPRAFAFCFLLPAVVIFLFTFAVLILVRDRPSLAGYEDIKTGDASEQYSETKLTMRQTLGKVLSNRVILVLLVAEFFTGFIRQGLLSKITDFFSAAYSIKPGAEILNWLTGAQLVGGIAGGLVAGIVSDRLFRSRRPPVAAMFYVLAGISLLLITQTTTPQWSVAAIAFAIPWIMGVHGMLSGTAAADFGGHKAAATATGLLDGAQYVAGGTAPLLVTIVIETFGWGAWMVPLVPAAMIGATLMLFIWSAKPGKSAH